MSGIAHVICAFLALTVLGCGGYFGDASTRATQAAVDVIDSPKYKKELDDMAAEAAGAARDKALDADTTAKLTAIRDAMLDEKAHAELASLREELLGSRTHQLTLSLVDDSLTGVDGYFAQWRETAFGQPLRDDLDALAADAKAKLPGLVQASMAPVQVTVATDETRAEHVAMWIGGALLALLLVVQILTHRRLAAAVAARSEAR